MTVILCDLLMALCMLLIGFLFYISKGKAANFLSGYNRRSKKVRDKYDEQDMCRSCGKIMMIMAIPFIVGAIIDYFYKGVGCVLAWIVWVILFALFGTVRMKKKK